MEFIGAVAQVSTPALLLGETPQPQRDSEMRDVATPAFKCSCTGSAGDALAPYDLAVSYPVRKDIEF